MESGKRGAGTGGHSLNLGGFVSAISSKSAGFPCRCLVVLVVLTALNACSGQKPASRTSSRASGTAATQPAMRPLSPLREEEVVRIEEALNGGDAAKLGAVLVSEVLQSAAPGVAALPAGSTIKIDPATLRGSDGTATVEAALTGPLTGKWLLWLSDAGDGWRVYGSSRL